MRIRISPRVVSDAKSHSTSSTALATAAQELANFIREAEGRLVVLTGAGVSTDSGVPDYRGVNGTYTLNPEYKPIFYQAFCASDTARHRYWARSFLGFPPVMTTEPNPTHYALAALQGSRESSRYLHQLVTQNVDGLHQRAGSRDVIELHGTLHKVRCMSCGYQEDRSAFQKVLADLNPEWDRFVQSQSSTKLYSRMGADGDVELKSTEEQRQAQENQRHDDQERKEVAKTLDYHSFQYPHCVACGTGHYKPTVVFFGENIDQETKDRSSKAIFQGNALLVMGTSLATFSALRLVKQAKDVGLPIAMVNLGMSRGDSLAQLRYNDLSSSLLMKAVAQELDLGTIQGEIKQRPPVLNVVGS